MMADIAQELGRMECCGTFVTVAHARTLLAARQASASNQRMTLVICPNRYCPTNRFTEPVDRGDMDTSTLP